MYYDLWPLTIHLQRYSWKHQGAPRKRRVKGKDGGWQLLRLPPRSHQVVQRRVMDEICTPSRFFMEVCHCTCTDFFSGHERDLWLKKSPRRWKARSPNWTSLWTNSRKRHSEFRWINRRSDQLEDPLSCTYQWKSIWCAVVFFGIFSAIPATDSLKFWVRRKFWLSWQKKYWVRLKILWS